jgi:hypothetical protein
VQQVQVELLELKVLQDLLEHKVRQEKQVQVELWELKVL